MSSRGGWQPQRTPVAAYFKLSPGKKRFSTGWQVDVGAAHSRCVQTGLIWAEAATCRRVLASLASGRRRRGRGDQVRGLTSSSWLLNSLCSFSFSILLLFILGLLASLLGHSSSSSPPSSSLGVFRFCSAVFFSSSRTRPFPLILYKDHRQTNSPPPSNWAELPNTLATSMKCLVGINGKWRKSQPCAVVGGRSDSPRHSPGNAAPEGSCRWMKWSERRTAPQANFSPLFSASGRDGGRGFQGGGTAGMRRPLAKFCQVLRWGEQISANHRLDQLGVILVLQHSSPVFPRSLCSPVGSFASFCPLKVPLHLGEPF